MSNLYELSARYQQLLDQDELSESESQEFGLLHDSIEDECISRAKYICNMQSELDAVIKARKSMQEREKALSNRIERSENLLKQRMMDCQLYKITKSPLFEIKIGRNNPSVSICDDSIIPDHYWRIKEVIEKTVDKDAVKKAIRNGLNVPGCVLVTNTRIEIK